MLETAKVICPIQEMQQELDEARALLALMKPVADAALEWMQVKDGTCHYPDYADTPIKNRYLYGMFVEMELYNTIAKYKKAK